MRKVSKVGLVRLYRVKSEPPTLVILAIGQVPTVGWSYGALVPYVYDAPPPDGYWEFDFVATPPSGPAGDIITPVAAGYNWAHYPTDTVNGVTVYASQNSEKMPVVELAEGEEVPFPW